jgi:pimeloyl-ACP methyl ester carboxylesterase
MDFLVCLINWKTIGQLAQNGFEVHLLDLRNHGRSMQSLEFSYELMAQDLNEYGGTYLTSVDLLGHSGGKTVMLISIKMSKLIIADIGPKFYPQHHQTILAGLNAVNFAEKTKSL